MSTKNEERGGDSERDFIQGKTHPCVTRNIRAFEKTIQARAEKGLDNQCRTGEELFLWWMEDRNIPGQMTLDFDGELKDEISDNG